MSTPEPESLRGSTPPSGDPVALRAALEQAFDYRGDVTLTLVDGTELVGYVSNRDFGADEPWIDCFPASEEAPRRRIPVSRIRAVTFSGRDTADGRSWEAWVEKWEQKKAAEAAGESMPDIEPKPTHLSDS